MCVCECVGRCLFPSPRIEISLWRVHRGVIAFSFLWGSFLQSTLENQASYPRWEFSNFDPKPSPGGTPMTKSLPWRNLDHAEHLASPLGAFNKQIVPCERYKRYLVWREPSLIKRYTLQEVDKRNPSPYFKFDAPRKAIIGVCSSPSILDSMV